MQFNNTIPKHVDSVHWQGYRGSEKGMVVFYGTDPVSEIPIREVPEYYPTEIVPEPHYETKTFGFYGCARTKFRAAFFKGKLKYVFFMTKYAGANFDYIDQIMVTGFYRIAQTCDVQKMHIRYLDESSCINEDSCIALRADEVHFVSVKDAFILTPEILTQWGASSRVTRQTRIVLDEEATASLLEYLRSKPNMADTYVEETLRLQPAASEDDEEEESDDEAGESGADAGDETAELEPQSEE